MALVVFDRIMVMMIGRSRPVPPSPAVRRIRSHTRMACMLTVLLGTGPTPASDAAVQTPDLSPDRLVQNLAARRFEGRPITIRVTGSRLQAAFEEMQRVSGLTFEVDPAIFELVRRTSSDTDIIAANQMPWDALLDAILTHYRLGISVQEQRLVVRSTGRVAQVVDITEPPRRWPAWAWPVALLLAASGVAGVVFAIRRRASAKPARSGFTIEPGPAERIRARVLEAFESDRIYRDERLSVPSLAARLSIPPHHLSWVVNVVLGTTFSRLVNTYRIDEVTRCLADPAQADRTILDIAFEAGFGTKTAFNKAFKAQTGMTPSEFREQARR